MNMMNRVRVGRRGGLLTTSLGLLLWLVAAPGHALAQPSNDLTHALRPTRRVEKLPTNIILILADDLGAADLSCYGPSRVKTPYLEQMAKEGMLFRQFYAGSPAGTPSRCTLLTGLHSGHAPVRAEGNQSLGTTDLTVAELLKRVDYTTGLIGQWGLGAQNSPGIPQAKGFDDFAGFLDATPDNYAAALDRFDPTYPEEPQTVIFENWGGKHAVYIPDMLTRAGVFFAGVHRPLRPPYHPFFLYLAYTVPHPNAAAPPPSTNDNVFANEPWPQSEKNKAAMLSRLDRYVGLILAKLKEWRIEDNTLVLFSAARGPHRVRPVDAKAATTPNSQPGVERDLDEAALRVPLLARWPGHIKPGESDLPAASWDVFPTLAEVAGTNAPAGLDGISFLPTLLGQTQTNRHEFLYWESAENGFQQAVRLGDWKAVRLAPDKPLELYNLKSDPAEKKNVAADNAKVLTRIQDYLKSARTGSPSSATAQK